MHLAVWVTPVKCAFRNEKRPMKKILISVVLSFVCAGSWAGIAIQSVATSGWNTPQNTYGTNSYSGISAQVGDVVVMTVSGNKKGSAVAVNVTQVGGSGFLGAQTALSNDFDTYPTSYGFFQKVTSNGTFNIDFTTSNDGGLTAITAVYVLRADSGVIELAGSASFDDTDTNANLPTNTLTYSFGTPVTNAVLIESVSARTDDASGPGAYTLDRVAENAGRKLRNLISHTNVNGSAWSSDYVMTQGDAGKLTSGAVGMAFAEVTVGNRAPSFNSDPVVAPGVSTNASYSASLADYATDLDGDTMTFWKNPAGPGWLSVATNGDLSGTSPGTTGINSWTVFVADNQGGTNSATLQINVTSSEYAEVPLTSTNLYVQGAGFVNIDGNGMNFHRFDFAETYSNVNAGKAKTTTGVKLSFYTRSDTVKLTGVR